MIYPGVYRAKCYSVSGDTVVAYIPQVFGQERVSFTSVVGDKPKPGAKGFVSFEAGDPAYPVWLSSGSTVATATNVTANGSAWQASGSRKITTLPAVATAWETTGDLGLDWSTTSGCEVDGVLYPTSGAAWWNTSAYARLTLWDGDPDDGGSAVSWPTDVLCSLSIGEESIAMPRGWGHNPSSTDMLSVSASGLILAGRAAITDGEMTADVGCHVLGQVFGLDPDLVVRVLVEVYAAYAAPALAWGGIA